jgi:hypothetical protein
MAEDISDEDQIRLVRDALIELHADVQSRLSQTEERVSQLETDNKAKNGTITTLANKGDEYRAQLEKKEKELEDSKGQAAMQAKTFTEHKELMRFKELAIYLPSIFGVGLIAALYFALPQESKLRGWFMLLGISIFVIGWLAFSMHFGKGKKLVENSPLFQMAGSFSKGIYAVLGAGFAWAIGKILDPYWDGFSKWFIDLFKS